MSGLMPWLVGECTDPAHDDPKGCLNGLCRRYICPACRENERPSTKKHNGKLIEHPNCSNRNPRAWMVKTGIICACKAFHGMRMGRRI